MAKSSASVNPAKIRVIGLGGGGCNAVTRMIREEIRGVEFIAMNTDGQALAMCEAPTRIQLGGRLTRGLGAGGDHLFGRRAAEESRDEIAEVVSGGDLIFITCGMGGGTGTGAAPIVAEIARKSGALTVAVITKPFSFEGRHRTEVAEAGILSLLGKIDTLIILPNDRLLALCDSRTGIDQAFQLSDDVLKHGVQTIAEVINVPGLINLDFADIRTIMKGAGPAWMSVGNGSGPNRALEAAHTAIASPLLDVSINGAKGVLFNVVGSDSMTLFEVDAAAELIRQSVDSDANIIFGVALDENMGDRIKITLIATGFVTEEELLTGQRDTELGELLKGIRANDAALDAPSFLRRSSSSHLRDTIASAAKDESKPGKKR